MLSKEEQFAGTRHFIRTRSVLKNRLTDLSPTHMRIGHYLSRQSNVQVVECSPRAGD